RWRRGTAAPGDGPAASRSSAPSPTAPPVATERWHVRAATTYPELDLAAGLVLAWSDARLMGLDPATGHTRWSRSARLGGAGVAKGSGGTPLRGGTAAGFAYLLDNTSFPWALSAVRASSGAVAWRQALDTYPLTPLVRTGDVLCFGVDGAVRAIGSDGGAARWSVSVDATGGLAAGGGVLVAAGEHALCGLSAATGRQLWRYALASGATPVVADGLAIASDTHGTLHAVRAADGAAVWRRAIHAAGPTPYAAGVLYATTDPGTVYALRTATGATVWTRRLGNPTNESYGYPSVLGHSDGTLHVGGNDRIVYALDAATGRPRWTYPAAVSLTTAPVTATGLVFIGTRDGYARALVPPNGGDRAGA
ncbi:MAG TPA: PQQ-binding-like beta-propeller repeat protein, partial [Actinocatenispora sp.]